MEQAAIRSVSDYSDRLDYLCSRIEPEKLNDFLRQNSQRVDELTLRMERLSERIIESKQNQLCGLAGRLNAVSPLKTLERGYGIAIRTEDNKVIRSREDVYEGDDIGVIVSDGKIRCKVEGISDDHV
jgi:exodeoxyribonuclease VII large subunit